MHVTFCFSFNDATIGNEFKKKTVFLSNTRRRRDAFVNYVGFEVQRSNHLATPHKKNPQVTN